MNINYDYYRIFYYVAKMKSFSGAAKALMNNQPNITRIIKKLEDELGCTLFIRHRHGVSLTPEGEKLYAHISIAFEHILSGEEEIAKERGLQSGIVTVAASEIALHCTLLPVLKEFRSKYPGVRIRVLNHSTPQAIAALKNGLADLALVTTPLDQITGLSTTNIREIQEVPVCSKSFDISSEEVLDWNQLEEYSIISLGEGTNSYTFYSELFASNGAAFHPDIEASTADQILPLVKSDLGIGFIPMEFLEEPHLKEQIMMLKLNTPIPSRSICLLKRKGVSLSIAAKELERFIKKDGTDAFRSCSIPSIQNDN